MNQGRDKEELSISILLENSRIFLLMRPKFLLLIHNRVILLHKLLLQGHEEIIRLSGYGMLGTFKSS